MCLLDFDHHAYSMHLAEAIFLELGLNDETK